MKVLTVGAALLTLALSACMPRSSDGSELSTKPVLRDWNYATNTQVLEAVEAAQNLKVLPQELAAGLNHQDADEAYTCSDRKDVAKPGKAEFFGECTYGDPAGSKLLVIVGDSAAPMWSAALELIALKHGWKMKMYSLGGCSIADLHLMSWQTNSPNTDCDEFRSAAIPAIRDQHPNLVITAGASSFKLADGSTAAPNQYQDGWTATFAALAQPGTRLAALEPIPKWQNDDPRCLAANLDDVQACSSAPEDLFDYGSEAPQQAAAEPAGVSWLPTIQWVCAARCQPVIADIGVYRDQFHFSRPYAVYLTGALNEALQPLMA